jgi:hypothetical protein
MYIKVDEIIVPHEKKVNKIVERLISPEPHWEM